MIAVTLAAAAIAVASVGATAPGRTPDVQVTLGPALQARAGELGAHELDEEREQLRKTVALALVRRNAPVKTVRLILQDIRPNRPTSGQLALSPDESPFSFGLGGAAVTGELVDEDGSVGPIRYRYFQKTLADVPNFYIWDGAEEAFDALASKIASGSPPDDTRPWPAPDRPSAPTGSRIPPG